MAAKRALACLMKGLKEKTKEQKLNFKRVPEMRMKYHPPAQCSSCSWSVRCSRYDAGKPMHVVAILLGLVPCPLQCSTIWVCAAFCIW